jgi:hypothetical protein
MRKEVLQPCMKLYPTFTRIDWALLRKTQIKTWFGRDAVGQLPHERGMHDLQSRYHEFYAGETHRNLFGQPICCVCLYVATP